MKRKSLLFLLLFALIAPWAANAQTLFSEGFEGGSMPTGWTTDGPGTWRVGSGDYSSSTGAGMGTYNALITHGSSGNVTKLITPEIDLSSVTSAMLSFMHVQRSWAGDIDYLKVYYRTSSSEAWTQLVAYTSAISSWTTEEDIVLPNTTATYQLAFEYTDNYGYGVGLDQVVISAPSACPKPTLGAAEYITEEGASFQWTENGSATQWQLQYSTSADFSNPTTIDRNGIPAYAITGLTPSTAYYVHVRSYCGDGEWSDWSNTVNFRTPCTAYGLPYAYGFEDAGDLNCWTVVYTANTPGINTDQAHTGSNCFRFSSYSNASSYDQYLISPMFNAANGIEFSFYYKPYSYGTENFKVGYSTTTNEASAFIWSDDITTTAGTDWDLYEATYPAGTKYVAIYYHSNYAYYLYVDDFNFDVPSDCRKPTNLATGEVGKRNATIRWTENGEATAWQVEVTDLDGGQVTTWNANATTYEIVGLTPDTRYSVRVNPVCDVEKWSDAITFTTEVACPAPVLTIVESTPIATTFSWTGEAQGYEMEYMVNPSFTFEDGTLQGWTNLIVNADGGQWLHSNDNPGGYMDPTASGNPYYPDLAHNGTGFAMCYSFIDNDGAYNTNAYLVSPRSYQINAGASMSFWYDMANDSWPENFEVCVATAANPTADDFTAIWSSSSKGYKGQKAAVRHRNNTRYQNWRDANIDLSAYVGQTIWIAFHDVNEDMYEVWIDDVMIDDGTIEWTPAPAPIASPYTLALEPGTEYLVRVRAICGGEDGESAWTTVTVTTPSNCDAPFDLNVTNLMPTTATLNWTGYQDGYDVWYRPLATLGSYGFEDGTLQGWTNLIVNADGGQWLHSNDNLGGYDYTAHAHNGTGFAMCYSFIDNDGAYNTDAYLVSPNSYAIESVTTTLNFWYDMANDNYPEYFEVCVATAATPTASDFTSIWTSNAAKGYNGQKAAVRHSNTRYQNWREATVDLSAYAGQTIWIAFHDVNEDMYEVWIDDITIQASGSDDDWTKLSTDATSLDIDELLPETTYEWQVRGENRNCTNGEEEGYTAWSEMGTFTTPGLCDNPNTFVFENLEATTATLTWTGYQESFNVMYRTAETYDELFYDDLEEGIDEWTTPNDDNLFTLSFTDGSSMTCYGFVGDGTTQTMISPEFESAPAGYALRFFYYAYQASIQTFNVGFSTDGENFTYIGEETTDEENYGGYYEVDVPEGAKYFAIQSSGASNYLLLGEFWIYANYVAPGDWVELTVTEPSVTMEPLTPETEYEVYVQGICGEGEDDVTYWVGGSFWTPEQTNITQTITLAQGTNWVSFYVNTNLDALKAALETTGLSPITIKAKNDGQTTYNGARWRGALNTLDFAQMYKIDVPEDCEISLEGMPLDASQITITIKTGDNWIGFPFAQNMTVTEAFASIAINTDAVRSKDGGQATYNGSRWRGALSTLVPGQGYIYRSAVLEDTPFVYPTSSKRNAQNETAVLSSHKMTTRNKSFKAVSSLKALSTSKVNQNPTIK